MLAEALESLVALASRSNNIKLIGEDFKAFYYANANGGGYFEREKVYPGIAAQSHSLASFADHVNAVYGMRPEDIGIEVWYDRNGAVCIFDADTYRRERLTFPLEISTALRHLEMLAAKGPSYTVKDLVYHLRHTFCGCTNDADLLNLVRQVTFTAGAKTTTEVLPNRQSSSRSAQAEISATVPDIVTFGVPLFITPAHAGWQKIACVLTSDSATEQFTLSPCPGAIEAAIFLEMANFGQRIRDAIIQDVPVYYGTP